MNPRTRGRIVGAVLLATVLGAGMLAGYALGRRPQLGMNINVRATTELPKELLDLDLTAGQRDTLGALLLNGRKAALTVMRELEPRMQAAMDSLDQQIHEALTPEQRTRLDASRKARGGMMRRLDTNVVVIDSGRGRGKLP